MDYRGKAIEENWKTRGYSPVSERGRRAMSVKAISKPELVTICVS
jgi:hypothetical protein